MKTEDKKITLFDRTAPNLSDETKSIINKNSLSTMTLLVPGSWFTVLIGPAQSAFGGVLE